MQGTATSSYTIAPCQCATGIAAACRPLPLRAAAPAVRPTASQPAAAVPDRCRPSIIATQGLSAAMAPAGLMRASRTACAAYSRTSWRTAILSEAEHSPGPETAPQPTAAAASPDDAGSAPHRPNAHEAQPGGPDGGDGVGDSGFGGTLSAAELRVKLALAAGSGRLDLTDCRLRVLPPEVLELTELEELQLSGNCLAELPDGLSRLTALRRLGLAGNLLTSLPAGIGALRELEGLWLHGNLLTTLPQQLGGLGALRALSLAGNCLESIPAGSLSGLTSLTDLTLAGNRLAALPPRELAPLGRLRKLALNGNRLGGGSPGELGVGAHMTALTELMLQGNLLESVDPAIFECPALQELSLADNQLSELPPRLAGASSLARLHVFGNRLTRVAASQLAGLPSLASCWLEGNPLRGETVAELLHLAASGAMPRLKALGLDQSQLAAATADGQWRPSGEGAASPSSSSGGGGGGGGRNSSSGLPKNVRVGCVLGSGPGYFKLQYGPQRTTAAGPGGRAVGAAGSGYTAGTGSSSSCSSAGVIRSSNELLVVAFGSAPGTPNWGGLLSKVYRTAAAEEGRYFDVLYVADPARDWYGGGDDSELGYPYYRERLSAYTRHYRRVLLLGDSMGATAALLFADLATAALAFCPQVDLTAASIRPGRPTAWLDRLRGRLVAAVRSSRGELQVLVGTWQHDLAQANLLPAHGAGGQPQDGRRSSAGGWDAGAGAGGRGGRASASRNWREAGMEPSLGGDEAGARAAGGSPSRAPAVAGAAAQRKPWAWEQRAEGGGSVQTGDEVEVDADAAGSAAELLQGGGGVAGGGGDDGGSGGVSVKVFSVDSHRLAAALDVRGQLVPLVLDAVMHQLGLRSGNVRVSNLL